MRERVSNKDMGRRKEKKRGVCDVPKRQVCKGGWGTVWYLVRAPNVRARLHHTIRKKKSTPQSCRCEGEVLLTRANQANINKNKSKNVLGKIDVAADPSDVRGLLPSNHRNHGNGYILEI